MNERAPGRAWRQRHSDGTAAGRIVGRGGASFSVTPAPAQRRPPLLRRSRRIAGHHLCDAIGAAVADDSQTDAVSQRIDVLASLTAMDRSGRLGARASTPVDSTRQTRRSRSVVRGHRFGVRPRWFWPSHTGPNPTDRAEKGCQRHVITDADGIPLVVKTTPANVRDDQPGATALRRRTHGSGPRSLPTPQAVLRKVWRALSGI